MNVVNVVATNTRGETPQMMFGIQANTIFTVFSVLCTAYFTLFVVDGNAQDFLSVSNFFWVHILITVVFPLALFSLLLAYGLWRGRSEQGLVAMMFFLVTLTFGLGITAFLLSLVYISIGSGGLLGLLLPLSLFVDKAYYSFTDPLTVFFSVVSEFFAAPLAVITALFLDMLLGHIPQYWVVFRDTFAHVPDSSTVVTVAHWPSENVAVLESLLLTLLVVTINRSERMKKFKERFLLPQIITPGTHSTLKQPLDSVSSHS